MQVLSYQVQLLLPGYPQFLEQFSRPFYDNQLTFPFAQGADKNSQDYLMQLFLCEDLVSALQPPMIVYDIQLPFLHHPHPY